MSSSTIGNRAERALTDVCFKRLPFNFHALLLVGKQLLQKCSPVVQVPWGGSCSATGVGVSAGALSGSALFTSLG